MKVDAHQHFWRYTPEEFGWLDAPLAALRRDFLPADLAPLLHAAGIDGAVAVQARESLAETRWLLALARKHTSIKGVVGWLPLAAPEIREILGEFNGDPHLKGARLVAQGQPAGFYDEPALNAGLAELTARGLTFDLLIFARQLGEVARLVDRHPRQAFVLDHLAKPAAGGAPPAEWRTQLRDLARRGHVHCKFSGLVTEVPGFTWSADLLRPYFEEALIAFGPQRLMFGSDWPVCLVATDYARWGAFVETCTAPLTPVERAAILGGNATRFYGL